MQNFLYNFFRLISFFNGEIAAFIAGVFASILLIFILKKKKILSFVFLNYLVSLSTVILIKFIVQKPRNLFALVKETSHAFPSGHTALALTTSLILFYLASFFKNKKKKALVYIFATLWTLATISARLYLKVHDWQDIITSLLIASFAFLIIKKMRIFRKDYLKKELYYYFKK